MNDWLLQIFVVLHFAGISGLALYGLHRVWLLYCWRRLEAVESPESPMIVDPIAAPSVTVQLPLFNERFVAARLIDAAAGIDWPEDRLEIQVLDDSTDDTQEIVDERIRFWRGKGCRINVIRRTGRTGYKAGALADGLRRARGEFIAIFDADFIPQPDFLKRAAGCFTDPAVGMVQTRWRFINAEYSWLTRIQALLLAPHFEIEHQVRCRRGLFFNFNGTAGIWRRAAIESAGGWRADTVTEDLDLSYRAQLAGWRFVYLDGVSVPSELPAGLAAFRSQQQRWAKGSIQTARKILPRLFRSPMPLPVKIEAAFHLLSNLGWLLGALVTLTLYPTIISRTRIGPWQIIWFDVPLFAISGGAILFYYVVYLFRGKHYQGLSVLPLLPALSIGLAPALALSIIQGLFRNGGTFERTPKFGLSASGPLPLKSFLYRQPVLPYMILNILLLGYMHLPVLFALERGTWPAIPFLSLFPIGFVIVLAADALGLRRPLRSAGAKWKCA